MERFKKCTSFVLLFVLLLTVLFTAQSDSVSAATPHPYDTYCSSAVQPNFAGWLSFMSQTGYYYQTGGTYYVTDKANGFLSNGYIQIVGNSASNNTVYASTKPIKFIKHTNGKYYANMSVDPTFTPQKDFRTFSGSYTSATTISSFKGSQPPLSQQGATAWSWTGQGAGNRVWSGVPTSPPANNLAWTGGVSVGQGSEWWWEIGQTTGTSGLSNPCKKFGNVTYDASWDTTTATTTTVDNKTYPTTQGCSKTDIGCLLQNVFATVENTFLAVGEAIVNGIGMLFSPDTETMSYQFTEFKDFMTEKLGFLAYPFEWIIDCLDGLYGGIVSDANWGVGICGTSSFDWGLPTGTFFGSNITIDWCNSVSDKIATATRIFFPAFISYELLRTFRRKLEEIHAK